MVLKIIQITKFTTEQESRSERHYHIVAQDDTDYDIRLTHMAVRSNYQTRMIQYHCEHECLLFTPGE